MRYLEGKEEKNEKRVGNIFLWNSQGIPLKWREFSLNSPSGGTGERERDGETFVEKIEGIVKAQELSREQGKGYVFTLNVSEVSLSALRVYYIHIYICIILFRVLI